MKKNEIKISTLIGRDCVLDGGFSAPGSARIDGRINGNLKVEDTLILGTTAVIQGNVEAQSVIIGGEVNGDVKAPQRAELTSTAKVIGDVETNSIVIDENAIFQGSCNMNQEVPERQSHSAAFRRANRDGRKSAALAVTEMLRTMEASEESESDHSATEVSSEEQNSTGMVSGIEKVL